MQLTDPMRVHIDAVPREQTTGQLLLGFVRTFQLDPTTAGQLVGQRLEENAFGASARRAAKSQEYESRKSPQPACASDDIQAS